MNNLLSTGEFRLLLLALISGPLAQGLCLLKSKTDHVGLGMLLCSIWSLSCGFVLTNCSPDEIGKPLFLFSFAPIATGLTGILSWLAHHLPRRLK